MKRSGKKSVKVETKYGIHLVVLEPDETKGYIATAPNFEGVITWGKNISHVKEMAKEAIELCIESLVEKNLLQKIRRSLKEKTLVAA